jgi:hypothetical protein
MILNILLFFLIEDAVQQQNTQTDSFGNTKTSGTT